MLTELLAAAFGGVFAEVSRLVVPWVVERWRDWRDDGPYIYSYNYQTGEYHDYQTGERVDLPENVRRR